VSNVLFWLGIGAVHKGAGSKGVVPIDWGTPRGWLEANVTSGSMSHPQPAREQRRHLGWHSRMGPSS
jgi:hypothetical protein